MKYLYLMGLLISMSAMANIKERYEIKFNLTLANPEDSYHLFIQEGKIVQENELHPRVSHCALRLGVYDQVTAQDPAILTGAVSVYEDDNGRFKHTLYPHSFNSKLRSLECLLPLEDVNLQEIKSILGDIASIKRSEQILSEDLEDKKLRSACEHKVLDHYSGIYHRTYKAASNTFLNNFIGRKNTFAHALGAPKIAFLQLSFTTNNYIADRIVKKSKKSKEQVYEKYMLLLRTGKLCQDLKQDYKKPRKVRKYLLEQLKNS